MAQSHAHKWGQLIGHSIELAIRDHLEEIAHRHNLYLDHQGHRSARKGKKVCWKDKYGNNHDLDYVLERGGSEDELGLPVAFIEIAWRRYTKHSRNKAQEIEGAIAPLAETYSHLHPFLGIVIAGEFTKGSVEQLRSKNFTVIHIKYKSVVKAFASVGIDASFDENTPEDNFKEKVRKWSKLRQEDVYKIIGALFKIEGQQINNFFDELESSLSRHVIGVTIVALHGEPYSINNLDKAIDFIKNYNDGVSNKPLLKYEINVKYSNGDSINATFKDKSRAISFLTSFKD